MEPGGAEQHGWIGRLTRFITGHPWTVTVLALAVAATCIWLTFQLRVNQQLRALLPSGSASVSRLLAMEARQGNQSDLYVVIRSPDRDRNIRFGEGIAEHLRQREDIRFVVFHQDYSFFEDRALLFMEMEDLEDLRERVKRRIQAEVRDELMGELEDRGRASGEEAEPLPDEDSLKEEYGLDDTLKEYFEADEGRLLVVKARPTGSTQDMEYSRHLVREVDAAVAALDPASFHPEMEVTLEGSFAENARRVRTMESNVLSGTSVTLAILFVSLLLFLRSVLMVTLSFLPLLVSTFAALAAGRLVFRELNLISAFIFAVLLGLGIDFSIHFLSRYREERAAGLGVTEACSRCLATSGVAMFFGALSTSASFLILVGSDFQGFVQFGLVGAVGVMLAIGTVFLVMPALLALIGRTRFAPPRPLPPIRNRTIPVWLAILLLVLAVGAAVAGVVVAPDLTFETNLNALGSNEDQPEDTGDRISYREAVGKATTTAPAIILTRDLEETRRVHRVLDAVVKLAEADEAREEEAPQPTAPAAPVPEGDPLEDFGDAAPAAPVPDGDPLEDFGDAAPAAPGPDGDPLEDFGDSGATPPRPAPEPIPLPEDPEHLQIMKDRLARVFSVFTFVPERQDEKLAVIADIKHRIDRKRGALTVETRETIDKWYRYLEVTEPFGVEALPAWVTQQFVDLEGDMGRFVIYWTKGPKADYRN
ncbi:MAG: MMPL family transporter, partial [Deltaproteobacteria bacterium]|nr:MMPL family transporter [Deltaproteobacteria bacterium]